MERKSGKEMARESLERAKNGNSLANEIAVIQAFTARGIPADEVRPRENVFTFWGWKALDRHVRKGEHGVRITTWIHKPGEKITDPATGAELTAAGSSYPKSAVVFHVLQTDPNTVRPDASRADIARRAGVALTADPGLARMMDDAAELEWNRGAY